MSAIISSRVRLDRARQQSACCALCEHRCGANRLNGERGPCRAGAEARVFRHRVECGDELQLIPSHLFYLSGCDLRCAFCIAEENAFDPRKGALLTGAWLRRAIPWGRAQGATNIQWVGGEPTIHLPAIFEAMSACADLPPVIWKSDFHGTPEAFELLEGVVDVFVADFKFGNDACAERIARVGNYVAVVTRNLCSVATSNDLIVRHLLLPGHFECCFRPVAQWLRDHLPRAKFSIRDGYLPRWRASRDPDLAGRISPQDVKQALNLAKDYGLNVIC